MESEISRIKGKFLSTALTHAAPFGITVTGMIALISVLAPFTLQERQTVMYLLLILISMSAVIKSCIPFNPLRIFICISMAVGTFGALTVLPSLFQISSVSAEMLGYMGMGAAISFAILLILFQIQRIGGRKVPETGGVRA